MSAGSTAEGKAGRTRTITERDLRRLPPGAGPGWPGSLRPPPSASVGPLTTTCDFPGVRRGFPCIRTGSGPRDGRPSRRQMGNEGEAVRTAEARDGQWPRGLVLGGAPLTTLCSTPSSLGDADTGVPGRCGCPPGWDCWRGTAARPGRPAQLGCGPCPEFQPQDVAEMGGDSCGQKRQQEEAPGKADSLAPILKTSLQSGSQTGSHQPQWKLVRNAESQAP